MPIKYKYPAYLGNALLLLLGLIALRTGHLVFGILLGGLAALNLFLVHKLDVFSREEVWLRHQLEMTRMQEELLAAQRHLRELGTARTGHEAGPDRESAGEKDANSPAG